MTLASVKVFIADHLLGFWRQSTTFTQQSSGRNSAWRLEMVHGAHLGGNGHYQPVATIMLYGISSVSAAWPFLSSGCVLKWKGIMCFLYTSMLLILILHETAALFLFFFSSFHLACFVEVDCCNIYYLLAQLLSVYLYYIAIAALFLWCNNKTVHCTILQYYVVVSELTIYNYDMPFFLNVSSMAHVLIAQDFKKLYIRFVDYIFYLKTVFQILRDKYS